MQSATKLGACPKCCQPPGNIGLQKYVLCLAQYSLNMLSLEQYSLKAACSKGLQHALHPEQPRPDEKQFHHKHENAVSLQGRAKPC